MADQSSARPVAPTRIATQASNIRNLAISCQFREDQILVLSTDGATETSDDQGTDFGGNGVLEYVREHAGETAQGIAAGVYAAARSFGACDDQHDDITSVIVKITTASRGVEQTPLPPGTLPN